MTAEADGPGAARMRAARTRARVLRVLDRTLRLRLPEARWDRLASVIEAAIAADAAGDLDALTEAATELELARPVRVLRIGSGPVLPPPVPVRERVEVLRDSLRAATATPEPGEDEK